MNDGTTDGRSGRGDAGPDRRLIIGGGLAAVLLAIIGATGGWVLAGDRKPTTPLSADATGGPTPSAQPTTSPPRSRPTPAAKPSSAAPAQPTGLTVPDLVGMDFEEAREELRDRGLGWRFVFGRGNSSSVRSTNPEAGTPVKRGITVVVNVAGAAPPNEVPDLIGDDCSDAKDRLVDDGFSPRYPTGKSGTVTAQDPPDGTMRQWNDIVSIWCGTA
ncbi:PASTA domain-containing protein [Micromonospora qiuiae]|nr:PASTA domain-containing protein [Micromonospora qiuiae]